MISHVAVGLMLMSGNLIGAQKPVAQTSPPTLRSVVDLVTLHVSVTDPRGRYLPDLRASEFKIFEDGRPQELRVFKPGGLPLQVVLFLDVSSSMYRVFPEVQKAAIQFLTHLAADDVASVISFANRVQVLQPFTGDQQALVEAVQQAKPHGATGLFNALYVGLNELSRPRHEVETIPRRRVAVLLTDGDDTASLVQADDVMRLVKRTDIAIYTIRLVDTAVIPEPVTESQYDLNQLTKQTGGRAFSVTRDEDLGLVYKDITAELADQYALGYISNDARRDGRFRHLSVQLTRPGARARTRSGISRRLDSSVRVSRSR